MQPMIAPETASTCGPARLLPDRIETRRGVLRAPRAEDARPIFEAYAADARVCTWLVWLPHRALAETEGFLAGCIGAWAAGSRLACVLTERASDRPIGMLEARVQGGTVDIGYVLANAHWGRGLMPEAVDALAGAALAQAHIFRVQATCDVENLASARALEKAGFVREGRLERHTVHPNVSPEPRACFMYARVRR